MPPECRYALASPQAPHLVPPHERLMMRPSSGRGACILNADWRAGISFVLLSLPGLTGRSSNPESPQVRERTYYIYILASRIGGTLYIGVTNDLIRRAYEHREKLVKGFTKKYDVARLVYFEQFGEIGAAIQREKQLKRWKRAWKIRLVEERNPNWDDLYPSIAIP
jgi:putative endonuclease